MDAAHFGRTLERILAPDAASTQPPLLARRPRVLHAAVASLALGGAERIVLDWAARAAAHPARGISVRIAVLRDAAPEWPVPDGVEIVRFHGEAIDARLAEFGARAAAGDSPVVSCHLLTQVQRRAIRDGGAATLAVLHNARDGWLEPEAALHGDQLALAVSRSAAEEYRAGGGRIPCKVVRHFPRKPEFAAGAREHWRERWAIPADACVIGMVGGVKPQKAYTRALRILRELLDRAPAGSRPTRPVFLVILGGPVGRDGSLAWDAVLAQARRLDVVERLRMPGFVQPAAGCLGAFDLFLNTSRYEGLSIATLEALAAGLPVVASRVGGQGEVGASGLALVDFDAADADWAAAVGDRLRTQPARPAWAGFPSDRLWNMGHLARPFAPAGGRVLFVTANLNAGGAQRSLVNLALALQGRLAFEIAVTGVSTSSEFARRLDAAGIAHFRSAATGDSLDHAEALIDHIVTGAPSCVCFWNVDAKIKLLLVKWLGHTGLKFVDVSPGAYLFEEMAATQAFQECIAYTGAEYYRRLDRLVQKYRAPPFEPLAGRTTVIPNGVPRCGGDRARTGRAGARIALCGRIAPGKFVLEAIEAVRLLRRHLPGAELHVLGTAEPRERDYALRVVSAVGPERGAQAFVFFHGPAFDAPERLADFDALLVLGRNQGCPNVVLEALAAGVPVVANDSGGTCELVMHGKTGLLVEDVDPGAVAAALRRVLESPRFARSLSVRGRDHARRHFSMVQMRDRYLKLFRTLA
jgi:glycosyltransferase involved in cell wall biosynthesis